MNRVLLLSVKPEFAEKIFNGSKKIELRKCRPDIDQFDTVIVYCTSPVKAVLGICQIKNIIKLKPAQMWDKHSSKLGIDKKRFMEYYSDSPYAIGLVLSDINRFSEICSLGAIKKKLPSFSPPQTYRYYGRKEIMRAIQNFPLPAA